jgi:hypothetical protein
MRHGHDFGSAKYLTRSPIAARSCENPTAYSRASSAKTATLARGPCHSGRFALLARMRAKTTMMRISLRHAAALALVGFLALTSITGCAPPISMDYYSDPSLHLAGWKCPEPDKMSHLVTHSNPPCASLPGGLFFKSCMDETIAGSETARGCVAESSATPASVPTP